MNISIVLGSPFPNFKRRVWKSTICGGQQVMSSGTEEKCVQVGFVCGTGQEMAKGMAS